MDCSAIVDILWAFFFLFFFFRAHLPQPEKMELKRGTFSLRACWAAAHYRIGERQLAAISLGLTRTLPPCWQGRVGGEADGAEPPAGARQSWGGSWAALRGCQYIAVSRGG